MKESRTALIYSPDYKRHLTGPHHPESPQRLDAIMEALEPEKLGIELIRFTPKSAAKTDILSCHSKAYFDLAGEEISAGALCLSTGDTNVSGASFEAAMLAAGGAIKGVSVVCGGKANNAFCALRPPGHHATRDRGMGFCIFNNGAIAARYAQANYDIERVLVVDWDVHHGNGTQDIFYDDPTVFYFSTHQSPHYPGTGSREEIGAGVGSGYTMNCPFPQGAGRKEIVSAFIEALVPAMDEFKPELIIVSAGFDSRIGDPLSAFVLADDDFAELTHITRRIADKYSSGRVVSVLEGGYDLNGLANAVSAHVTALAD